MCAPCIGAVLFLLQTGHKVKMKDEARGMNPNNHLVYDNPLVTRYASQEMAELWGPRRKFSTWHRLWVALAEAQHELGLPGDDGITPRISAAQVAELRAHVDDIDFVRAEEH